jgi:Transferase family
MDTNAVVGDSSPMLTFPLTPLDQLPPRLYIRLILSFPLQPSSDRDRVVEVLRYGLKQTITDIPYLTGKVCLRDDGERSGRMEIRRQLRDRVDLQVKDLTVPNSGWASGSYDELHAKHMPPSLLDGDVLSPVMLFPDQNMPASMMAAQANFIPGGLLLCVAIHHSITDGVGMATVLKTWANWCRRGPDSGYIYGSEPEFPISALDRSPLMKGLAEIQARGHKEYKTRPQPSQELAKLAEPSTALVLPKADYGILYFSAGSLALLKAGVSSFIPSAGGDPKPWISTNDALIALFWSCVTRARLPRLQGSLMEDPEGEITLGSAVDGRSRLVPPLPQEYVGNVSLFNTVTVPLSALTSATSLSALSTLAVSIRESIARIDDTHIRSAITFVDRTADVRTIIPGFRTSFSKDFYSTSWADQRTMEVDWGNVVGGVPTHLRLPNHPFDGMCIVYPRLLDRGLEVLVGLHADDMKRLKSDELLCKFASWRHA